MVNYCFAVAALVVVLATTTNSVEGFKQPSNNNNRIPSAATTKTTTTSLNVIAPPLIIGPMIRKMREEQEKKRMPMATDEEQMGEAPGLRVGGSAWKWPPVWPYDKNFFLPSEDIDMPKAQGNLANMANVMQGGGGGGGGGGLPDLASQVASTSTKSDDKEPFDHMAFWAETKANVKTELDEDAIEKLKAHYSYYIKDGSSVLELGAAEESYIPESLTFSRHVGIGANKALMDQNPALTDSYVVDLNDVEPERGVNSETLRELSQEQKFDVVLMANTVDFLMNPREVFRSAFHLLKPGGIMLVSFSNKKAYSSKFQRAQTKMWRDYNDDQHMWMTGSFFQFSAGDGWEDLKGFDISPSSAKDAFVDGPMRFLQQGKENNLYCVQATRAKAEDTIDPKDPEAFFKSKMWMLPTMEERDKALTAPRLRRAYEFAETDVERDAVANNVDKLPKVYESLVNMDQFAFTFSMQSQLAVDVVTDPDFRANDEQVMALKRGLGLREPDEFWTKVGTLTNAMNPEDKINLLAHIVPRFGSGDPAQEDALESFVTGLTPTFALVSSTCPTMAEGDVQLLGTELLAAEILKPGRSTRKEFAEWVGAMSAEEMEALVAARKDVKQSAAKELKEYRQLVEEREAELEQQRSLYDEQVAQAREARTITFDIETGKFKPLDKKAKK